MPTVEDADTVTAEEAGSGSHTFNVPTNTVDGETILLFVGADADATAGVPTGYTNFFDDDDSPSPTIAGYCHWKRSDGSEPTTGTYTTTGGFPRTASIGLRISGAADPDVDPPVALGFTDHGGVSDPNPADADTGAGSAARLWVAGAWGNDGETIGARPANYDATADEQEIGGFGPHVILGDRELDAESEDPGAWTLSFSNWLTVMIVVHPSGVITAAYPPFPSRPNRRHRM